MGERIEPEGVQMLECVRDPVTVTVSDVTRVGASMSTRTATVCLGACSVDDILAVISAASAAARANGGEGA